MGAAQTEGLRWTEHERWLWLERAVILAAEWRARQSGDTAKADALATRVVELGVAIMDLHRQERGAPPRAA